ncbi:MAG: DUF971 domain-containing protein [Deltaproteobacteria bacterium]|nr:DUF971 domain-containing protein [Deltaproteobacteria bacterium]
MSVPVEVRAPIGADQTAIVWSDGTTSEIPNELMRGYCPCAGCQGHSGQVRFRAGGNPTIDSIAEVGSYALSFQWGDGHDSGIYTFDFLKRLGDIAKTGGARGALSR